MTLSLDMVVLGVPEVQAAHRFYTSVFSPVATDNGHYTTFDMHGTGRIGVSGTEALATDARVESTTSGVRGYILSYIVSQPSEVENLLDAAVRGGAHVLKPPKKGFFGGFSAAYQAPDGAIWKLSSPSKKNTSPAGDPPRPTETAVLLGVARPQASKAFYEALGMTVDRDYGNKYVDFRPISGTCRLGLMPWRDLAKDVGVNADGTGFGAVVFHRWAESRDEVDAVLAAAVSAGGQIAVAAGRTERGDYAGHFIDPDGFVWKVVSA